MSIQPQPELLETLKHVMASYGCLRGVRAQDLRVAEGGLINETFLIGQDHVLQRLHPIFGPGVNDDINAVGGLLRRCGVSVPEVRATDAGDYSVAHEGVWRLLSFLPGRTLHQLGTGDDGKAKARSAGRLVGRFHAALAGETHAFSSERPFHDTAQRLSQLDEAVVLHRGHRFAEEVGEMARGMRLFWDDLDRGEVLPRRICHGDLKVSNLRFARQGHEALSILDLDTLTMGTLDAELGDAFRSWCNPSVEHDPHPKWDMALFRAAWEGLEATLGESMTDGERVSVVQGTMRITLELSARFAADALNESYFGFDPKVAGTRGEHNLMRARSQWALTKIVKENQAVMRDIVLDRGELRRF